LLNALHSRRNALLCAMAVALCVLLIHPVLEMPINDDFSYTKSAFDFARTGHILFNGWATTMLGWQIIWGGLFVKIFGHSFTVVRLSMLPIAMAATYLLHQILVRFGANSWNAVIGALTMGLSPLFIPLTTSFMSDVSAVFCILLCLYMCQRAMQSTSDRSALTWLCLAAACNVVDGTVRQIVWFGALVMVPTTGWIMRKRRHVLPVTAVLWILSVVGIEWFMKWFKRQPYSVPIDVWEGPIHWQMLEQFVVHMTYLLLTLLLFVLPLLVASFQNLSRLSRKYLFTASAIMVALSAAIILRSLRHSLDVVLGPWLVNVVSKYGMVYFATVGPSPLVLPRWVRLLFTLVVLLATIGWIAIVLSRPRPRPLAPRMQPTAGFTSNGVVALTVPFALSYIATLAPRAIYHNMLDRYVLPIIPALIILLVLYYQNRIRERLPTISIAMLAVLAAYAVAGTHDFFSMDRARLAAANEVELTGVPRSLIHGFLEYDAWTQLEIQGHINEKNIRVPAGVYQPVPHKHQPPEECRFWYADDLPAVHPKYIVVFEPQSCLTETKFSPVTYRTWLPPFSGRVEVQQQPDKYDWIY
jgi:hypothetical protein